MLRARLGTIVAPGIPQAPTVSLTAYADDVTVILQSQEDVKESLGDSLIAAFMGAGMTKLGHLLDRENGRWKLALEVSAQTGVRSLRLVADLLDRLRVSLPTSLSAAASSAVAGIPEHVVFPELRISPYISVYLEDRDTC
ncbi:unnamed protein product [Merluccius merluccius]